MRIILENAGKKYRDAWVFRHLNFEFHSFEKYSVTGPNGSGKSTLLNIVSGRVTPDEGSIVYEESGKKVEAEKATAFISMCSPYIELIEEFTLEENYDFFVSFKKIDTVSSFRDFLAITGLQTHSGKFLQQYSTGMKQRVKLALAFLAKVPVLLLDEPCSGLDAEGQEWYRELISKFTTEKMVLVGSNEQINEYYFCKRKIHLPDFQK